MRSNTLRSRLLFFILVLCLTLPLAVSAFAGEADGQSQSIPAIEYYGRTALAGQPNAEALLYAYDQIYQCVENADAQISVYDGVHPLSAKELETAFDAYHRDHGEHFWVDTGFSYRYNSTTVTSFSPTYNMTGDELKTARVKFEEAASRLLEGIDGSMSEFERELILHDRLAGQVVYLEGEHAHTAYGALVDGVAVCDGYSLAFEYLLQRSGLQSFIAIGFSNEPTTGEMIRHAWNFVRIDGEYYQTDVTWDDQGAHLFHAYFNQSDDMMKKDHYLASKPYEIPTCTSTDAMYFRVKGGYMPGTKFSEDEVVSWLAQHNMKGSFYLTATYSQFIQWMNKHLDDICLKLGLRSGYTCEYWYVGGEIQISITNDCKHNALVFVNEKAPTCTQYGNEVYYECACGWLFKDRNGNERIEDPDSVLIDPIGHDYTEKIGDEAHIKTKGANCQTPSVLWYDCSRCASNAKDDPDATDAYYTGTLTGDHQFTRKIADTAHLVAGSGADCKHAKEYYYQCAHCDQIGTAKWASDSFGDHKLSTAWSAQGDYHFHKCTVSGCSYTADRTACSGGTATCKNKAKCSVCKSEYGALAAHSYESEWKSNQTNHWHECIICGNKKDSAAHTPGPAATETTAQTCKTCAYVLKAATGHIQHTPDGQWKSDETHHWYGCIGCTDAVFDYAPHVYDNACDGECNECKAVRQTADHVYDNPCDADCNECQALRMPADHVYDNDCDADCNICQSIRTVTHSYGTDWMVSETSHWHECACGAIANAAVHTDDNGDGKCDACAYTMQAPPETTPPETMPPETMPPETTPPETMPPETTPPETTSPETTPPETTPPETTPPETTPPETTPPETTPPVTTPPVTTPPTTTTTPVDSRPSDDAAESDSPVVMIVVITSVVGVGGGASAAIIITVRRRRLL